MNDNKKESSESSVSFRNYSTEKLSLVIGERLFIFFTKDTSVRLHTIEWHLLHNYQFRSAVDSIVALIQSDPLTEAKILRDMELLIRMKMV